MKRLSDEELYLYADSPVVELARVSRELISLRAENEKLRESVRAGDALSTVLMSYLDTQDEYTIGHLHCVFETYQKVRGNHEG